MSNRNPSWQFKINFRQTQYLLNNKAYTEKYYSSDVTNIGAIINLTKVAFNNVDYSNNITISVEEDITCVLWVYIIKYIC